MPATTVVKREADRDTSAAPPDAQTLFAFAATAILAGGNAVAVKLGYAELAPFWGAAVRFLSAAAIMLVVVAALRLPLPRGRALAGVVAYGALNFGLSYIFLYWALTEVTAGALMVVLAIVPLLTLLLAVAQRVEVFSRRGLIGALMAAAGIAVVFGYNIGIASFGALAALILGAISMAQVPVLVKTFPRVDPMVENGLGMAVGGAMHLALSLAVAEPWIVPGDPLIQGSLIYLVLFGSIGLFLVYLFVLGRWTASATSYVLLLAPLATVLIEWAIMGEAPSLMLIVGGALVIAGVYIGAIAGSRSKKPT
jgi:drug/metabolite transporter (DMT)-like permease